MAEWATPAGVTSSARPACVAELARHRPRKRLEREQARPQEPRLPQRAWLVRPARAVPARQVAPAACCAADLAEYAATRQPRDSAVAPPARASQQSAYPRLFDRYPRACVQAWAASAAWLAAGTSASRKVRALRPPWMKPPRPQRWAGCPVASLPAARTRAAAPATRNLHRSLRAPRSRSRRRTRSNARGSPLVGSSWDQPGRPSRIRRM